MTTYTVEMLATVKVTIKDPDVITRVLENHDDEGVPQPRKRIGESGGWQDMFYHMETEDDVIEHLAYNCIYNSCHDASRMDGWADLPPKTATMDIVDVVPV